MRGTTFFLLVLICLWAAPAGGQAQKPLGTQPAISQASIGYSKNVRSSTWIPVQLVIENPGPAAEAEVLLFNEEVDGLRLPGMTRTNVHLPAKSIRQHTTYILDQGGKDFVFELRVDGQRVSQLKDRPIRVSQRQSFVLGLSVHGARASCDAKKDILGLTDQIKFGNLPRIQQLPHRWQALAAVDAIVLGDLPQEGLSLSQEQAVVGWVRAGGVLILSPSVTDETYEGSLFADISPVQILGRRQVAELPPLEEKYGALAGKTDVKRVPLNETTVVDGTVHMQMDSFPLVVSRREGLGRVVFVAFDLSAESVSTIENLLFFYQDIIALRTGLPKADRVTLSTAASNVLDDSMGVPVLSLSTLALCLGANFAIVAIVLFWKQHRRELGFGLLVIAAPVVAVVFSFLGHTVADISGTTVGSVNVVRSKSGESYCAGSGFYALLAQHETRSDVSFPDENSCFPGSVIASSSDELGEGTAATAFSGLVEVEDGDSNRIKQLHVRPRSLSKFQTIYATELSGSIRAEVLYDDKGLDVDVTNNSDKPLKHCFVVCNRNMTSIEDLAPGESTRARLNSGSAAGLLGNFSSSGFKSKEAAQRDKIVRSLYASKNLAKLADTGVLVCGWFDGAPRRMRVAGFDAKYQPGSETLWVVEAESAPAAGEVLLPKGTASLRIKSVRGQPIQDGRWVPLAGKHVIEVAFEAPKALAGLEAKRLTLFWRTSQAPARTRLQVYNIETDTYDTIAPTPTPGGAALQILNKTAFELSHPEKYLSIERGEVRVIAEMELASETESVTSAIRHPIIEDFDIELQGTCP